MSQPNPDTVKQQSEFIAWGMPIIYLVTASVILGAFIPHFRANAGYLKQHIAGYVGKLAIFAVINIICSIFLFWSPAIHYGLINFLLNFMILCTISLPTFPTQFAKNFAFILFIWMSIFTGIAPVVNPMQEGVLSATSVQRCQSTYQNEDVRAKICKDGWVTFIIFCSIITIGLTFLANLILISVAFDPVLQSGDGAVSTVNDNGVASDVGGYQQPPPIPAGGDGEYQSYQNGDNNA